MGHKVVWHKIALLLEQDEIPRGDNVINITDGRISPWWLWVSNLENRTVIIGEGIREVHLNRIEDQKVVFNFIRVDNTRASLLLGSRYSRLL